jgi:hypothetical protein
MYRSHLSQYAKNSVSQNRIFLYEVFFPPYEQKSSAICSSLSYSGRTVIKVPYCRIQPFVQRINRVGGKILSVQPLVAHSNMNLTSNLPWWVEISTITPKCLYYFGPFSSSVEAQAHQSGYIEDLQKEGAQGITAQVKQCQPAFLTQEG